MWGRLPSSTAAASTVNRRAVTGKKRPDHTPRRSSNCQDHRASGHSIVCRLQERGTPSKRSASRQLVAPKGGVLGWVSGHVSDQPCLREPRTTALTGAQRSINSLPKSPLFTPAVGITRVFSSSIVMVAPSSRRFLDTYRDGVGTESKAGSRSLSRQLVIPRSGGVHPRGEVAGMCWHSTPCTVHHSQQDWVCRVGSPKLSRPVGWPRSTAPHRCCWQPFRNLKARTVTMVPPKVGSSLNQPTTGMTVRPNRMVSNDEENSRCSKSMRCATRPTVDAPHDSTCRRHGARSARATWYGSP